MRQVNINTLKIIKEKELRKRKDRDGKFVGCMEKYDYKSARYF